MIQIFDELDFVTIDNGVMTVNKEAEKREIEDSQIFQDLKRLVKFQELMALGTPQEIYDWLYKQGSLNPKDSSRNEGQHFLNLTFHAIMVCKYFFGEKLIGT